MSNENNWSTMFYNFFYDPDLIIDIPNNADYLTAAVSSYRSTIYSAAKALAESAKIGSTYIRVIGLAADAPFTVINIALSVEQEGILKATATGITADGTALVIGGIVGGATAGVPGAITGAIITGGLSLLFNPMADTAYDFYSDKIQNVKYNNGELIIETPCENLNDIKTFLEPTILYGSVEKDEYIKNITVNQNVDNKTTTYSVKSGDTMFGIANRFGINLDELIEANPWLADRYSDDKKFALIKPDEQIIIPEGSIKGTDNTKINQDFNNILNGTFNTPDKIAPENVTLPNSGKTENINVQHYTSKPQMLSNQEILFKLSA